MRFSMKFFFNGTNSTLNDLKRSFTKNEFPSVDELFSDGINILRTISYPQQ